MNKRQRIEKALGTYAILSSDLIALGMYDEDDVLMSIRDALLREHRVLGQNASQGTYQYRNLLASGRGPEPEPRSRCVCRVFSC